MADLLTEEKYFLKGYAYALSIVIIGIISRVIPHVANFSPEIVFALYLSAKHTRLRSMFFVFLMAVPSDIIIGMKTGYFIFGTWTLFTYSALALICMLRPIYEVRRRHGATFLVGAVFVTFAYWCWTNLGTWLIGGIYQHNLAGLISCYTLAIPFLDTALIASLVWSGMLIVFENLSSLGFMLPRMVSATKRSL